jgi:hypothetical protein
MKLYKWQILTHLQTGNWFLPFLQTANSLLQMTNPYTFQKQQIHNKFSHISKTGKWFAFPADLDYSNKKSLIDILQQCQSGV